MNPSYVYVTPRRESRAFVVSAYRNNAKDADVNLIAFGSPHPMLKPRHPYSFMVAKHYTTIGRIYLN